MYGVRSIIVLVVSLLLAAGPATAQEDTPGVPDTLFQQGMKFYSEGQYRKAADSFAALRDSTNPAALFYLALSHLSLNDVQAGIPRLRRAVMLAPSNAGYRFQYARSLAQSGSPDLAITEYAALIAADSGFTAAHYQMGLLLYEQKRYAEASGHFSAAIDLNPVDYLSYYYLSSTLVSRSEIDSARPYLASCMSLNPTYVPAIVLLASIYFSAGEHDEALRLYANAAGQRPHDADLMYKIGLCYGKIGKIDSAIAYVSAAARRDTSNDIYVAQAGYYHLLQERYDSALTSYQRAIAINAENSLYFINLAYAFSRSHADDSAKAAYERGIAACHPENIAAIYLRLGTLHYFAKEYKKALSSYQRALDLQPMSKEAQYYVALAYDQLSSPQSAVRQYRRYLELARDDTSAQERERKAQAAGRLRTLSH